MANNDSLTLDSPTFHEFVADKVYLYVNQQMTDLPGLRDTAKVKILVPHYAQILVAQLTAWCASGRIPTNSSSKVVRWPDGVWQMIKERHMPRWFTRWFPVRYHEESFDITTNHYFVCPHLVTDPQSRHVKFMATGTHLAGRMG